MSSYLSGSLSVTNSTAGSYSKNKLAVKRLPEGPSIPHRRCPRGQLGGGGRSGVCSSLDASNPPVGASIECRQKVRRTDLLACLRAEKCPHYCRDCRRHLICVRILDIHRKAKRHFSIDFEKSN